MEIVDCALGRSQGSADLVVAASPNSGASTLVGSGLPWSKTERVSVGTLDDVLEKCGCPNVDMIKIDVEGFEFDVSSGAERVLARRGITALAIELHVRQLTDQGLTPHDVKMQVEKSGYIWKLDEQGFMMVRTDFEAISSP